MNTEQQFQSIAYDYAELEKDEQKSRYELEVNWPSIIQLLPKPPARVLDYGAGSGLYAGFLNKLGYSVMAVDNSQTMVSLSSTITESRLWDYKSEPLQEKYDAIIAKLVVQFIEDLSVFAQSMRKQLAARGQLIISVPHPDKSRRELKGSTNKYETFIGDSSLQVVMIHREKEEYIEVIESAGFRFIKSDEPIDTVYPNSESKRMNLLFEIHR